MAIKSLVATATPYSRSESRVFSMDIALHIAITCLEPISSDAAMALLTTEDGVFLASSSLLRTLVCRVTDFRSFRGRGNREEDIPSWVAVDRPYDNTLNSA